MATRRKKSDEALGPDDSEVLEFPIPADGELNVESLLTNPDWGFSLTTATNVQRAACRIIDGRPIGNLAFDPDVVEACGGVVPDIKEIPATCILLWSIRGAKSMISVCKAVTASQAPFRIELKPGDTVRIPIVSTELATAKLTFAHLVGALNSTPYMRSLIVKQSADTVILRHPTGRHVEVTTVALSRAGSTLVGCWMPCCIFDESPRMSSDADFVRSLKESYNAVQGRIMPGGTIMLPGSPHKPVGMIFEMHERYWGNPSSDCVVFRAIGPKVNPGWYTPEFCETFKRRNPKLYRRDVLAEFDDADDSLFSYRAVEAAMKANASNNRRSAFVATLFPASHRSAWTLVVLETWEQNGRLSHLVALARETASVNMRALAKDLAPFKLDSVMVPEGTPQSMLDEAEEAGLVLIPEDLESGDMFEQCREVQALLSAGRLFLPYDKLLRGDLIRAQLIATPDGNSRVAFPLDEEGRRCDFAPLLARAIKCAAPPEAPAEPEEDDEAREVRIMSERKGEGAMIAAIRGVS